MQSFCSQSAHKPAYRVCWGIQLIVPPLGNLIMLKSVTFRTSFSAFDCLPAPSVSRAEEAITKTIPRDRRKLMKLMLRKWTFLPPRSHLIRQFVKRHLVTIRREQHVLAQWLRQYFCHDHCVRSVYIWGISSYLFFYIALSYTQYTHYTLRTPWSWQNIVSTTAPERAVLSVLSLGVALWTAQSGASEVAETCFFLASISLAVAGHVILFWLWLPRRGRWTAPVDSEIQRKICEMLEVSVLEGYQVEALYICMAQQTRYAAVCVD